MAEKDIPKLIADCQVMVRSIAWKIHQKLPRSIELEDLISYGNLGLAQAARDFDAERGKFSTYAHYRVRGAILDGLEKMNWFKASDYHRGRYENLAGEVLSTEESGANDTTTTAGEVGWTQNTSVKLAMVHLLCQNGGTSEAFVDDDGDTPEHSAVLREMQSKLRELVDALPSPADVVIRSAYFEGKTLKEVGESMGKSKSWASRIHTSALEKLARDLREYAYE